MRQRLAVFVPGGHNVANRAPESTATRLTLPMPGGIAHVNHAPESMRRGLTVPVPGGTPSPIDRRYLCPGAQRRRSCSGEHNHKTDVTNARGRRIRQPCPESMRRGQKVPVPWGTTPPIDRRYLCPGAQRRRSCSGEHNHKTDVTNARGHRIRQPCSGEHRDEHVCHAPENMRRNPHTSQCVLDRNSHRPVTSKRVCLYSEKMFVLLCYQFLRSHVRKRCELPYHALSFLRATSEATIRFLKEPRNIPGRISLLSRSDEAAYEKCELPCQPCGGGA